MTTARLQPLDALHAERLELRCELARAWELREPVEHIRQIERRLREIWTQIEENEASAAPAG